MKLISQRCPHCGAELSIDPGRQQAFCQYCGTKLLIEDENTHTININYRNVDEARLKEAEVRLKELEYAREQNNAHVKEVKSWRLLILVYIAALAVSYFLLRRVGFAYIFFFGALAVLLLKPKNRYENQHIYYASGKSKVVAFILCFFFGVFGAHYFYVGRLGMGILYLFTFGIGGLGWLIDIIRILIGTFRDKSGRLLR